MSDFPSTYGDDVKWHLSLRCEQPIEGCEVAPHPYLKIKSAALDNPTKARLQENHPHAYTYRWFRGPKRNPCANDECSRNRDFSPVRWSRPAIHGHSVLCAVCERAGVPRYLISFCSLDCFKASWRAHSVTHPALAFPTKASGGITKRTSSDIDFVDNLDGGADDVPPPVSDTDFGSSPEEWVEIHNEATYTCCEDDVGRVLKIECKAVSATNQEYIAGPVVVYTSPVLAAPSCPPPRPLRQVSHGGWGANVSPAGKFRVLSYNILAEVYATKQIYPLCDSWSLLWTYRKSILLREIMQADADILCMQEVQADHFSKELQPFLDSLGFSGLFDQKTREAMGQAGKIDGCAIFYRRSKFRMQETYVIKYNDCAVTALSQHSRMEENTVTRHIVRLSRGNIAQVAVLELAPSENALGDRVQICLANTHLYSNHMYPDVKLWQTATLMREIEAFVTQRDLPIIICGDFNSEPHSAVYQYMSQGAVDAGHPDLEPVLDKMLPSLENSRHSLELLSAMQLVTGEEPEYTNYTSGFKGVLDYVWFSPQRLRASAVVEVPPPSALLYGSYGLPNATYPSDHLFLCCDFIVGNAMPGLGPYMGGGVPNGSAASMASASSRNVRRQFSNSPPPTQPPSASKMKQPGLSRHTTR